VSDGRRKIKKQTANKASKAQARAIQIGPNAGSRQIKSNQIGPPEGKKKDKSNQIPAQTNQMKPNTSTDKSNQIEPVHLDVPLGLMLLLLLGALAWQGICSWGTLKWVWSSGRLIRLSTPSGGAGCSQGKK
jgi:hypothetical protein